MRRLILIPLAAAVLLLAAAVAGVGRPEAARGDATPPGTVTTVGHGSISAVPDVATVTAGVRTDARTAADALSANAKKMNDVVAALKRAGGDNLQTQQVSLYPQTDPHGHVTGYTAQDTVSARSKISAVGGMIDAAVAAGANTVDGPSLDLSDRDALYRDALKQAVGDARAKAQALADAGGFSVGRVSVVTENPAGEPPIVERGAVATPAATPIEPGTQDVTADVTVTFAIV
ncbi:MAG: SIMPL domain-containing protein [Gaiellaceae bacterium]